MTTDGPALTIKVTEMILPKMHKRRKPCHLIILIDILNPEIIVLGSVYERSEDLLWPCAQRVIEQEALAISREGCRIVPAKLGNKIGDYAALSVAIQGGKNGQRVCSV